MQHLRKLVITSGLLLSSMSYAAVCSRVKIFTNGSILTANDLNTEFNTIFDCNNNVTTDQLSPSLALPPSKIGASIAGDGLIRDSGTGILSVNPDDVSIQVAGDLVLIKDSGVSTVKIADLAVTTAKLADANVTTAKLADQNVTTAKIADQGVTTAKLADVNVTTAKIADLNVTTAKLDNGAVTTAKIDSGAVTKDKMAGTNFVFGPALNLSQNANANVWISSAAVNFNSTGRTVLAQLVGSNNAYLRYSNDCRVRIREGGANIVAATVHVSPNAAGFGGFLPTQTSIALSGLDTPGSGAHQYFVEVTSATAPTQTVCELFGYRLMITEI